MTIATRTLYAQPHEYRDDSARPWAKGLGLDVVDRIKQLESELAESRIENEALQAEYSDLFIKFRDVSFAAECYRTQLAMLRTAIDDQFRKCSLARAIHAEERT